jgi:hypothetical protein
MRWIDARLLCVKNSVSTHSHIELFCCCCYRRRSIRRCLRGILEKTSADGGGQDS